MQRTSSYLYKYPKLADLYITEANNLLQQRLAVPGESRLLQQMLELLCTSVNLNFAGIVRGKSAVWYQTFSTGVDFPDPESYKIFKNASSLSGCFANIPIFFNSGENFGCLELYSDESGLSAIQGKFDKIQSFAGVIALQIEKEQELEAANIRLKLKELELDFLEKENRQYQHISTHTLKEPLRKLHFFTDLIEQEIRAGNTEKAIAFSLKVKRFAAHFSGLLEDISRFANLKPAAGRFETVNLNEIVLMVCSQLSSQIQEKEAWIEKDALPDIVAVPLLITQLFLELIRNALWFSRKELSPVINIAVDKTESDPGYLTLRISDNGIGIADYHLQKVFDVFERFHPDGALPGSGIGLSYCQKIIHYHGGTITPHSVLGEGTTFVLRLPLDQS